MKVTYKGYETTINTETGSMTVLAKVGTPPTGDNQTGIDFKTIIADALENPANYKHEDQSSSNGDIGIGTDGNPVNMDLWKYDWNYDDETYEQLNTLNLAESFSGTNGSHGYVGDYVNGEIIGKVPQYIKPDGSDKFYEVTGMNCTFYENFAARDGLLTAPKIPTSVTSMVRTFYGCTNLEQLSSNIPEDVENLQECFENCTNLAIAPIIPSKVRNASRTFFYCEKLTGSLVINVNEFASYGYDEMLYGASTNDGCELVLSGTFSDLAAIMNTASSDSHIRIPN